MAKVKANIEEFPGVSGATLPFDPASGGHPVVPTADAPTRFLNRELSWLAFNRRVLEEAHNPRHPLLERLRFLSISASNLDEFYMVRVAGLKGMGGAGVATRSDAGRTPAQQIGRIDEAARLLIADQRGTWAGLRNELRAAGIVLLKADELSETDRAWLDAEFREQIFPENGRAAWR